ncbi:hypothetical protein BDZ89DRAFT_1087701 [Hymenopellis radicata]|nr:hypothetical protein BDZ89DRAFT_1087701 [Hymenopellis radicata]
MSEGNTAFTTGSSEPNKSTGQYHSVKGNIVEAIGNTTGATSWQQSGREERAAGEAEINTAKAKGYAEGAGDRLTGKKDSIVGAVTSDKQQQMSGNVQQDKGQTKQDMNRWS